MVKSISIITPVLNGKKHLPTCIRSVAEQEAEEVEHLIIDGGSTDGTSEWIETIKSENDHLRFIVDEGSSQSIAMNTGIRLAQGKILGFLNADDYYEPGVLNRIMKLFESLPEPAFVVANCQVRDGADRILRVNRPERMKLTDLLAGAEPPYNPAAYFYHKSVHQLIGLYDEGDHYTMDLDFIIRLVQRIPVFYYNEIWGNFRWFEGAKTFDCFEAGSLFRHVDSVRDRHLREQPWMIRQLVGVKRRRSHLSSKIQRQIVKFKNLIK